MEQGDNDEPENYPAQDDHGVIAPSALESAEGYLAGSAGTGTPGDGGSEEFSASLSALVDWGLARNLIRSEADFPFFKRPPDAHGDEHEAWFYEPLNRWFKATYPNRFWLAWGRDGAATAREYLSRLVLQNEYFFDDIELICLLNSNEKPRVLTSQSHIAGRAATYEEIREWFLQLGFCRLEADGRIAWYRKAEKSLGRRCP